MPWPLVVRIREDGRKRVGTRPPSHRCSTAIRRMLMRKQASRSALLTASGSEDAGRIVFFDLASARFGALIVARTRSDGVAWIDGEHLLLFERMVDSAEPGEASRDDGLGPPPTRRGSSRRRLAARRLRRSRRGAMSRREGRTCSSGWGGGVLGSDRRIAAPLRRHQRYQLQRLVKADDSSHDSPIRSRRLVSPARRAGPA